MFSVGTLCAYAPIRATLELLWEPLEQILVAIERRAGDETVSQYVGRIRQKLVQPAQPVHRPSRA
jgi:hypothetical protein